MLYDYAGALLAPYPTIKGDSVTDDTAALQALVNTYKSVRLPSNLNILISGTITIDPNKCKLFDGGNSTIIINGDFSAFSITGSMTSGMSANPSTLTSQIMQSEAEFKITNCKIRSNSGNTGNGILINNAFKVVVSDCYLYELKNGILISNLCRDLLIANNNIYACEYYGIYVMSSANLHQFNIVGNLISYCYYCLYLYQPDEIANMQCTGNDIEISTYPASGQTNFRAVKIVSGDGKNGQLSEMEFVGNTIQGHTQSGSIIDIAGGNQRDVKYISIVGNHVSNCTSSAILLNKVSTVACSGNTFKGATYALSITDSSKVAVVGNCCDGMTGVVTQSGTNTSIVTEHNIS